MAAKSKSRRPFVDEYLAYLLARASFLVSRQFHVQVKDAGLSVLEWRVLATLVDRDGLPISDLAQYVLTPQPTLTKLLIRMETAGWVKRSLGHEDRRKKRVLLTRKGQAIAAGLLPKACRHEGQVLAAHSAREIRLLKTFLREVIERDVTGTRS